MRPQMFIRFISVFVAFSVAGCASMTEQNPIIDTKNANMVSYPADLTECRAYAEQVDMGKSVGESALTGGAVGAGIGAIVGLFDKKSFGTALGAGALSGAIGGGVKGAVSTFDKRKEVVANCLKGRGYSVLSM
jgi:outer membrane lipoprotein SlyB